MANTIGALDVALTANSAAFVAGTQKARNELRSFAAQANTSLAAVDRGFTQSSASAGALISRYLRWAIVIQTARRALEDVAKQNTEAGRSAAKAIDDITQSWGELQGTAAPAIAWVTNRLTDMLNIANGVAKGVASAVEEIKRAPIFGGMGGGAMRTSGVPLASAANPYASMVGKDWKPGAAGFPAQGMTDLTPGMVKAKKAAEDAAKDFADTFAKGEQAARESQSNLIASLAKSQSEDIKKIWEDESAFKSQMLAEEIERQNAASQAIVAIEGQTAQDVQELWDGYVKHREALGKEILEQQVMGADRLRMSLMEVGTAGLYGFKSLGNAAAQFLEQIAVMIFQMRVLKPIIESIGGAFGTSGGGTILGSIFGAIGGALGGGSGGAGYGSTSALLGMAAGGPASGGTSYLVGERGPELFTPGSSGRISPNGSFGGGVTINVDARGSNMTEERIKSFVLASYQASVSTSLDAVAKNRRNTGRG